MPRPRKASVVLPAGVHVVKARGRVYYYWQPGRGTAKAAERRRIEFEPEDPRFWQEIRSLGAPQEGTLAFLAAEYRASPEYAALRPASRRHYDHFIDRLEAYAGTQRYQQIARHDVYELRNELRETPSSANQIVKVLRLLLEFGCERGWLTENNAVGVKLLKVDVEGAKPWPEQVWMKIVQEGPENLRRTAILGRAIGQRRSDLVKIGAGNYEDGGISFAIGKLRDKKHWTPIPAWALKTVRGWCRERIGPFIVGAQGRAIGADALDVLLRKHLSEHNLPPVTLHGLRAMAVIDRRAAGLPHQKIAAEIGMSVSMVERYSKNADQALLAGRKRFTNPAIS